jgi:hypothetical protein
MQYTANVGGVKLAGVCYPPDWAPWRYAWRRKFQLWRTIVMHLRCSGFKGPIIVMTYAVLTARHENLSPNDFQYVLETKSFDHYRNLEAKKGKGVTT